MAALSAFLTVLLVGCESSSPVAPSGTILIISASPTRIARDGVSTITVEAKKSNGSSVNPGTPVRFTTTIGTIDDQSETDGSGVARATLRGDGRVGTATITATTGAAEPVSVDVQVGFLVSSITLQATPASVPEDGGSILLVALVRDEQGDPLAGASVNFKTDVGTLESQGSIVITDQRGEAADTLAVTDADINTVTGDTFQAQAEVGGSGGNLLTDSATITIARRPRASFSFRVSGLSVVFTDTSTGNPTTWFWRFGDGNTTNRQNPTHSYAAQGSYTVELTATNSQGSDTVSDIVEITGQ